MITGVKITKLGNGARVVTSSLPHVESASVGVWVGAGGRHETRAMAGASHFIEHLLFKGTKSRTARAISNEIEGRGGYLNAFTQEESTCYYARAAADRIWLALDVLADMYLNPLFDSGEIQRERGVIIEEIMMYRDQPQHMVQDMLGQAMWEGHPLGMPVIGFPETVRGMSRADILDYWRSRYTACNTVFAFAGLVDHDECVERVEKYVGGRTGKRAPSFKPVTARTRQGDVVVAHKDAEQAHIALGVRLFGRHDKRRYVLRVLNTVLGENMSSRLFQIIREKHGLAYSIHSSCQLYNDSGAMVISAGLDKKRFLKGLELVVREMDRLRTKKVGQGELSRAKEYITGQLRLSLESTSNQMMYVGESIMAYGKYTAPSEVIKRINAVTADDVMTLAQKLFNRARTTISLVSPGAGAGDEKAMRRIARNL